MLNRVVFLWKTDGLFEGKLDGITNGLIRLKRIERKELAYAMGTHWFNYPVRTVFF